MGAMQQMLMAAGGAFVFNATISANTTNYNLRSAAITAGWNQVAPLLATITVNSGVYVGSTSTGTPAFDTGVTFPAGSSLALVNNGTVCGMGGAGAPAGGGVDAGSPGGLALKAQAAITVTNNGTIGGGGGGGGEGGNASWTDGKNNYSATGGSGGGGRGGGAGGGPINPGTAGTYTAAGTGGAWSGDAGGGAFGATNGGNGGGFGAAGATAGSAGGSSGAAVNGNSNITWVATGTRLGAIT